MDELVEVSVDRDVLPRVSIHFLKVRIVACGSDLDAVKSDGQAFPGFRKIGQLSDQVIVDPNRRVRNVAFQSQCDRLAP